MKECVAVFVGGGIGSLFRWGLSQLFFSLSLSGWLGTLAANLFGCTLLFLMYKLGIFEVKMNNFFLKIGLLGGLTTFSTFTFEIVQSLKTGMYKEAALILVLNIVFGIIIGIGMMR